MLQHREALFKAAPIQADSCPALPVCRAISVHAALQDQLWWRPDLSAKQARCCRRCGIAICKLLICPAVSLSMTSAMYTDILSAYKSVLSDKLPEAMLGACSPVVWLVHAHVWSLLISSNSSIAILTSPHAAKVSQNTKAGLQSGPGLLPVLIDFLSFVQATDIEECSTGAAEVRRGGRGSRKEQRNSG